MEIKGFRFFSSVIDPAGQTALVEAVMAAAEIAPFYRPITPGGKPMSVQQTSFGPLGWITDRAGYRYEPRHPVTGAPWPAMPQALLDLWAAYAGADGPPDACLVNLYRDGARMGLHQDADEADFAVPVLSISLGDTAVFRLGGPARSDPTRALKLASGDICVLGGEARLAYHGVDRVLAGSSRLVPGGGRINLTLRRAAG
ncbi:MAG TPA: alpha-ketoglutarate-dependent dioxygenase AlkB [Caulobacteraceae bacterium]|nr:alpha-ketoglutarate-dependent dioxygenase AlkB [Caulobacteraceae bacterium]